MIIAKFVIPGRLMSLNEYDVDARANRLKVARDKKSMMLVAALAIREAAIRQIDGPVDICIRWIEPTRRRDWDNVTFAKKAILDDLQKENVIPSDSSKRIPEPTIDLGSYDRLKPRIEVYIKPYKREMRFKGWEDDLTEELGFNPFNMEEEHE